jgi:hypothetical protein
MSLLGRAALGLVLAAAGAGCVAAPAGHDPLTATPVDEIGDPPAERPLRLATVRVRNLGCGSLSTGSGVVVDDGLIATNRHVVDGARRLEINTWDGRTLEVDVASAASQFDLALVRVSGRLPPAVSFADRDLEAGDTVTIAGYPGGRHLTMVTGAVRSVEPFEDEIGDVALVDAPVRPGNSGGPVGNQAGRLVGIVYAATTDDNDALVIPVSLLRELRDAPGFAPVAPCDPDRVSVLDAAAAAGVGQATLPPPPSPTVPLACPVGRPAAELTALDAAQRHETEPAWDVHLDYRLSNDTGQAISVREVDVTITYGDGTTSTHTFEGVELSAGQAATVEQTVATGRPDAAPQSARIAIAWRWADDTVARRCPAGE